MKQLVNLNLYKQNRLEKEYKQINAIYHDEVYLFKLDNIKTSLSSKEFIRETNEYKFVIDLLNKKASYLLKEQNILFDIHVEKLSYNSSDSLIELEYKLSSDEDNFKIELLIEGGYNE